MMTIHGVIHGKTIELEREPGWPEGERVAVTIDHTVSSPARPKSQRSPASNGGQID